MTIHPGGHKLRPFLLSEREVDLLELEPGVAHMLCRNCGLLDPEPGTECDDEPSD
jgi:hypothetical protein